MAVLLSGWQCNAGSPTEPAGSVEIVSLHRFDGQRLVWDPNDEPVLSVAARATDANLDFTTLRWRQNGWQVDDSQWLGRVLRVSVDTPGCGYGGHAFALTAVWPDGRVAGSVTVWMEKYICEGSPWARGSGL